MEVAGGGSGWREGGGGGGLGVGGGMNNRQRIDIGLHLPRKKGFLWSFFPAHVTLIFSIRAATTS